MIKGALAALTLQTHTHTHTHPCGNFHLLSHT